MKVMLGGTFDPVHIGHLRMATELAIKLELEHVHLMPCYQPVHKEPRSPEQRAASHHRMNMLRLAIEGDDCLQLDEREIRRARPSYTIDSLLELREEIGSESLCLAMGADAAREFQSWKQADAFSALAHIVVMQRPGWQDKPNLALFEQLGFDKTESVEELKTSSAGKVFSVALSAFEVSSSDIRAAVRARQSIHYLVTDAVRKYICDNALYQCPF